MKSMIFSVTAGQGHNQTAKAISDALAQKGVESNVLDSLSYSNRFLAKLVDSVYWFGAKKIPHLYGSAYRFCEAGKTNRTMPFLAKKLLLPKTLELIEREKPDVLVATHVFSAILADMVAKSASYPIRTFGIVTDFAFHPYWDITDLNYYVVPSELMVYQGQKMGLAKEKFLPIGIPIAPKFAHKLSRTQARNELGIEEIDTVLVMSGSAGFGNLVEEIKRLDNMDVPFQMITVCGNNAKLKQQIDKLHTRKNLYNFGFVNNVDIMMDAANCIVTKPGGLTTSEALAKGLPMIMVHPVPGQEDRNVEFLLNAGAAIKVSKTYRIDDAIYEIFSSEQREASLHRAISSIAHPASTEELAKFICNL